MPDNLSNFTFLKAEFSLLHSLCLQAKYYLYSCPNAVLLKLRQLLFDKADTIELRYTVLEEKIDHLSRALLAKALNGELVPQLPRDGDAKELLEKIRQVREAIGMAVEKKRKE